MHAEHSSLLFLLIALPALGALFNGLTGRKLKNDKLVHTVAIAAVAIPAVIAWVLFFQLAGMDHHNRALEQTLFNWIHVGSFQIDFTLWLDPLSAVMLLIITNIGALIHLYSVGYMKGDASYYRFFSYLNLFIFAMLCLVLGKNLLVLFLGWEGVGLASYLLIGFWFEDRENAVAGKKAFIVNRVGDFGFALGMMALFVVFGTLSPAGDGGINAQLAANPNGFDTNWIEAAAILLFIGACGKSAQIPLYIWLPDAMAGPTPVSALIHAATMVTAGVYMIARMNVLFFHAEFASSIVLMVGAATALLAATIGLVQNDIKKVLAYSTVSQLGFMFVAMGAGAYAIGVFHLMTHAFFKALLFLASGAVIVACHHEQNIFKMGGLWKKLPLAYASFIVGGAALAALPLVTAGFYSKDEILWEAFASGHQYLLYAGLVGAFMTSLYTFRLIFIAFHGEAKTEAHAGHGISHWLPLSVLIVLSTFIGAWIHPPLAGVLPESAGHAGGEAKHSLEIASGAIALAGILLAALLFLGKRRLVTAIANSGPGRFLSAWWFAAWGFDWVYDVLFVKPYLAISRILRGDPLDHTIGLIPRLVKAGNGLMSRTETGQLRWYAASIAAGAVLVLGAIVLV